MSRELKADTEQASAGTSGLICKDGIVAVVNNTNSISNLTKEQLKISMQMKQQPGKHMVVNLILM